MTIKKPPPYDIATRYHPRGSARALFTNRESEVLIEGPAGTGKTRACLEKAHLICEKYAGTRVLLVRKTRHSMTQSVLVTFEECVVPSGHPILKGRSRDMRNSYPYPKGSELVLGGLDKPDTIMSTDYDFVFAFEATELTEGNWERLLTRLRWQKTPYRQAVADCNPSGPSHWLNQRANNGMMRRLLTRHEDNPLLHDGKVWTELGVEYIEKLERLTGPRYQRLRKGIWAAAEGLVWDRYDPVIHLRDRFEIPADWRRFGSIDFGTINPFSASWWAVDPDGRMFRYRQIYHTGRLVQEHVQQIKAESVGENIEVWVCDHDADGMGVLQKNGLPVMLAKKDKLASYEAVQSRFHVEQDGKARLYFLRDSLVEADPKLVDAKMPTCTEQELEGHVWKLGADGRPKRDEWVDRDNHGIDEMRYAVMYVDGAPRYESPIVPDRPTRLRRPTLRTGIQL